MFDWKQPTKKMYFPFSSYIYYVYIVRICNFICFHFKRFQCKNSVLQKQNRIQNWIEWENGWFVCLIKLSIYDWMFKIEFMLSHSFLSLSFLVSRFTILSYTCDCMPLKLIIVYQSELNRDMYNNNKNNWQTGKIGRANEIDTGAQSGGKRETKRPILKLDIVCIWQYTSLHSLLL